MQICKSVPTMSLTAAERTICKWMDEAGVDSNFQFVQWASGSIKSIYDRIAALRRQHIKEQTSSFAKVCTNALGQV
jgi:hypothetical protein